MYYIGGMNQQKIANELSLSRIKVTRLLQQALDLGIINISIGKGNYSVYSLEKKIKEATGIKYCVVVPSLPDLADALSRGTAHLCNDIIGMKGMLGIGLSRTICYLYKYLNRNKCKVDSVISISGSTSPNLALSHLNSGYQIAHALGVDYYTIWAPVIVGEGLSSSTIKKDRYISMVLEKAKNADYILVGIGNTKTSQLIEMKYITNKDYKKISQSNAEGEIIGHYLTIDGKQVMVGIEDRLISVEFPMRSPVIGVAGGQDKEKAIVSALRSGWLQGLVTDENTASGVLQILQG
jgi:DNA-binding transcriptional regulator LsrR (DeoR family)